MFAKNFYHGLASGIMAALAAIIYNRIHFFATEADFSRIINMGSMIGGSLLACMLIAVVYYFFTRWFPKRAAVVFPFLLTIFTFAAVIVPISVSLPLDIKTPELFPGLAVPMVFFPAMAWFTLQPIFPLKGEQ